VKVVFALGYSKLYEEIVREEYINNEDVIQFSFLDTISVRKGEALFISIHGVRRIIQRSVCELKYIGYIHIQIVINKHYKSAARTI
jgi:hypothetical protein